MLELGGFLAISAGLLYLSLVSLRRPRSHGFYRFFCLCYQDYMRRTKRFIPFVF